MIATMNLMRVRLIAVSAALVLMMGFCIQAAYADAEHVAVEGDCAAMPELGEAPSANAETDLVGLADEVDPGAAVAEATEEGLAPVDEGDFQETSEEEGCEVPSLEDADGASAGEGPDGQREDSSSEEAVQVDGGASGEGEAATAKGGGAVADGAVKAADRIEPVPGKEAAPKAVAIQSVPVAKPQAAAGKNANATVKPQAAGGASILKPGTYVFVAGTTRGKVLDVANCSTKPGANVIIWSYNGGANQRWSLSYTADGLYAIIRGIGGNVLEVAGSRAANGVNVRMGVLKNTANQKWVVVRNPDGTISLNSALNQAYRLDITGCSGKDGTNVEIWSRNATTAQKWVEQDANPKVAASAPVNEGWYTVQSSLNGAYYLDVTGCANRNGTQLELWRKNPSTAQAFRFFKVGNYYRIESGVESGYYLDVEGGKLVPGTKGEIWRSNTNCALFSLQRNADGTYRFVNVASGLALGVSNGRAANGSAVNAEHSVAGAKAQSFKLISRPGLLETGVYSVKTALPGNRAMGARGSSSGNGASMVISSYAGNFSQKWYAAPVPGRANVYTLESLDTGYRLQAAANANATQRAAANSSAQWWVPAGCGSSYVLKNVANGQLLDVSGAKSGEGSAVITWKSNGGVNQKWQMAKVPAIESGIYEFRNGANMATALDVTGASEADGANVELWTRNNGANQRWYYNTATGTIVSMCSGKYLDVSGASTASGANVLQWSHNGGANQKWNVTYEGGGKFKISSNMGRSLVLTAASGASGANVVDATYNGRSQQLWKPVKHDLALSGAMRANIAGVNMANVRGVGIDVSQWQGSINWGAVKNAGVNFAIIRVGHGTSIFDSQLANNVRGCLSNGIPFGLYYYSTAANTAQAKAEAAHCLKLMKRAGVNTSNVTYGVYYDLEESSMGKASNRSLLADIARTFLGSVQGSGYKPGVYANLNWWNNYLTDPVFNSWNRWVAQWRVPKTTYGGAYKLWQSTCDGSVPGISGHVDIDVLY